MLILQNWVNFEPQGYQDKSILAKIDQFYLILQYQIVIYCEHFLCFRMTVERKRELCCLSLPSFLLRCLLLKTSER